MMIHTAIDTTIKSCLPTVENEAARDPAIIDLLTHLLFGAALAERPSALLLQSLIQDTLYFSAV